MRLFFFLLYLSLYPSRLPFNMVSIEKYCEIWHNDSIYDYVRAVIHRLFHFEEISGYRTFADILGIIYVVYYK